MMRAQAQYFAQIQTTAERPDTNRDYLLLKLWCSRHALTLSIGRAACWLGVGMTASADDDDPPIHVHLARIQIRISPGARLSHA